MVDGVVGRRGGRGRPLVLIVEDETGIAAMLAERIAHAGYRTAVAVDGFRALDVVLEREPDLVLCDLYLPNQDGETFIRRLRAAGKRTPVVVMSAAFDGAVIAQRAEATGFLAKPFQMSDALAAIERAMAVGR